MRDENSNECIKKLIKDAIDEHESEKSKAFRKAWFHMIFHALLILLACGLLVELMDWIKSIL
ncbi:hypothetical protein ACNO7O_08245 [Bisgaard Taxon 45]